MNNIVQTSFSVRFSAQMLSCNDYNKNYHLKPIFFYFMQIKWIHDRLRGFRLRSSNAGFWYSESQRKKSESFSDWMVCEWSLALLDCLLKGFAKCLFWKLTENRVIKWKNNEKCFNELKLEFLSFIVYQQVCEWLLSFQASFEGVFIQRFVRD